MYRLLGIHIMFGNGLRFGFLRLAMCISFTKREITPFRVNLHLPFQHVSLSYRSKYLHPLCRYSQQGQIFPQCISSSLAPLEQCQEWTCFIVLFSVTSGIMHTIPTEPFLIFLIGKIIFLLAVTQCVICFTFIEIILLAFTHFIQLLTCC